MEPKDYPALYQQSDSSAITAQRKHFWLVRIKIAFLVATAAMLSITWGQAPSFRTTAALILAILFVGSISFTAAMNYKRLDKIWLDSRTIAESTKRESWLFTMNAEPYDKTTTDAEAEELFLNRLGRNLHRYPSVSSYLAPDLQRGTQITEEMKRIRNETFENRRDYYAQNRIRDQKLWYADKAKWNKDRESLWFVITWVLEFSAAAIAILLIVFDEMIITPVGIITTAGAGILSWVNARSYSEPAESYGIVAQDLLLSEDRMKHVQNEKDLAEIVRNVEGIINREHTIWIARL